VRKFLQCAITQGHRDEHGASLVEFAISSGALFMAAFGIFEFAFAIYTYMFVISAAQQGARYAIVRGAHWGATTCASTSSFECNATGNDIQDYVQSLASPGINPASVTVNTTWPQLNTDGNSTGCTATANSPGCEVKISVSYPFVFPLPYIHTSSFTLTGTAEMTIQQ
jgi:Flp pilus assembly protein TadG